MELEKKYLLKENATTYTTFDIDLIHTKHRRDMNSDWELIDEVYIEQGYLDCIYARHIAYEQCSVDVLFPIKDARVRKQGRKLTLAFKSDGALTRHKVEIPIDQELFDELWKQTEGQRVLKTRFIYSDGKHEIKINVYDNLPLIVAEVEFLSEKEAEAMVPFGKDVTADAKYKNRNLVS